jgi:hypothetical protein
MDTINGLMDARMGFADDDTCALHLQPIHSDADKGYADIDGHC